MTMLALLLTLFACLTLRIGFIAFHLNHLESLWYDFERRGFLYRLAQSVDLATFLAYIACAAYTLWMLPAQGETAGRFGTVFVAWTGVLLLERLAVHRVPRTNSAQLYADAQINLLTNLLLAVMGGAAMTCITAAYFWLQGRVG